jgi:endogenous inhibitor of DNA gyrase (YacG/DUF329 family)
MAGNNQSLKVCIKCGQSKPLSDFHNDKSRKSGVREACKGCRCKLPAVVEKKCIACGDLFSVSGSSKAQKYCGKTCQRVHIRYGIDEYKHEDLLLRSDYKCAICGNEETNIDKRTNKPYELSIDHDHKTGIVRGVLCFSCNSGLGSFKDDVTILKKAIRYLKKSGSNK